jgi:hypothetical protein
VVTWGHVVLGSCNYLSIPWGFFGIILPLFCLLPLVLLFLFPLLLSLAISCALGLSMETNGRKRRDIFEWM